MQWKVLRITLGKNLNYPFTNNVHIIQKPVNQIKIEQSNRKVKHNGLNEETNYLNQFYANVTFLCPLKTSFLTFSGGYRNGDIGKKYSHI